MKRPVYDMEAAVRAGIAYLDQTFPDWRQKVDWERLDMNSASRDVRAMVGVKVALPNAELYAHGFFLPPSLDKSRQAYADLTEIWKRLGRETRTVPSNTDGDPVGSAMSTDTSLPEYAEKVRQLLEQWGQTPASLQIGFLSKNASIIKTDNFRLVLETLASTIREVTESGDKSVRKGMGLLFLTMHQQLNELALTDTSWFTPASALTQALVVLYGDQAPIDIRFQAFFAQLCSIPAADLPALVQQYRRELQNPGIPDLFRARISEVLSEPTESKARRTKLSVLQLLADHLRGAASGDTGLQTIRLVITEGLAEKEGAAPPPPGVTSDLEDTATETTRVKDFFTQFFNARQLPDCLQLVRRHRDVIQGKAFAGVVSRIAAIGPTSGQAEAVTFNVAALGSILNRLSEDNAFWRAAASATAHALATLDPTSLPRELQYRSLFVEIFNLSERELSEALPRYRGVLNDPVFVGELFAEVQRVMDLPRDTRLRCARGIGMFAGDLVVLLDEWSAFKLADLATFALRASEQLAADQD